MVEKKLYKLMGADGREYFSKTPGTFGGNSRMKIYGRIVRRHFLLFGDSPEVM